MSLSSPASPPSEGHVPWYRYMPTCCGHSVCDRSSQNLTVTGTRRAKVIESGEDCSGSIYPKWHPSRRLKVALVGKIPETITLGYQPLTLDVGCRLLSTDFSTCQHSTSPNTSVAHHLKSKSWIRSQYAVAGQRNKECIPHSQHLVTACSFL